MSGGRYAPGPPQHAPATAGASGGPARPGDESQPRGVLTAGDRFLPKPITPIALALAARDALA